MFYDEPFLLQSSLHSLSPWQLLLGDTRYQLNKSVTSLNQTNLPKVKDSESREDFKFQIFPSPSFLPSPLISPPLSLSLFSLSLLSAILSQQDVATEIRCIKVCQSDSSLPPVSPPSDIQLTLGSYHYQWSRKGEGEEEGEGSSVMMLSGKNHLPQVNVKYLPYSVTAGTVHTHRQAAAAMQCNKMATTLYLFDTVLRNNYYIFGISSYLLELPSHATQHELVLVNFKVNNKTIYVHEFETHLSVNSDFISSGNKLVSDTV